MKTPLIVSVGMPRAGSGWHFNLIHDLVVESGGIDARKIRKRFLLQLILTEINCNIGAFTPKRLIPVMIPVLLGNKFVIKAHAGLTPLVIRLIQSKRIIPIYIFRDPRDALLSAYEYGQKKKEEGRSGAFTDLDTINAAIEFMKEYVAISEEWLNCDQALHCRYEDLLLDYDREVSKLVEFLNIDLDREEIQEVIEKYRPTMGSKDQRGTHFRKGIIGRYRGELTPSQKELCQEAFGTFLIRMGYPIE